MTSITLQRPIQVQGETVSVLELQEPTYEQVEKWGLPFSYSGQGDMKLDMNSTLAYLPELAQIPRSSAQQMALPDVVRASMTIVHFFTGSLMPVNSDSDSTTSPGSGVSIP